MRRFDFVFVLGIAFSTTWIGSAWAVGLTEDAVRDVARVTSAAASRSLSLNVLLSPAKMASAVADACHPADGENALAELCFWHIKVEDVLKLDHTPKVEGPEGQQIHLQQFGPHRASYVTALVNLGLYEVANAYASAAKPADPRGWSWIDLTLNGGAAPIGAPVSAVGAPPSDSLEAAALAAVAHDLLRHLYSYDDYGIGDDYRLRIAPLKTPSRAAAAADGERFGQKVAALILGLRAGDKSTVNDENWGAGFVPLRPLNDAFQWRQDPISQLLPALGTHWGDVKTFLISSPDKYVGAGLVLPDPPADLSDQAFTEDLQEVRYCGFDQQVFSPGQTRACVFGKNGPAAQDTILRAKFWSYDGTAGICAPVRLYNQIADQVLSEHADDILLGATVDADKTARIGLYYAGLNLALVDAGIVAWYAKYKFQIWRPTSGVRYVMATSDPDTKATWFPLGAQNTNSGRGFNITPPFPAYPSGHSVFGSAFFETLRHFVPKGKRQFTIQSDELKASLSNVDAYNYVRCSADDPLHDSDYCKHPRKFTFEPVTVPDGGLVNAEQENSDSRIWLGVHWRSDGDNGMKLGDALGVAVANIIGK